MKVLFVATVVRKHIMVFHIPYLKSLKEQGWETFVAAKNDYETPSDCVIPYCDVYYNVPFERSPISLKNLKAFWILKTIIDQNNFDVIHCHTPVGGVIARLASLKSRKKGTKVIYTAHGFHFYKGGPLINWILYYPIERFLARKTDILITINKEDYRIAKKFKAQEIQYMSGVGIDISIFKRYKASYSERLNNLGINQNDFVILFCEDKNCSDYFERFLTSFYKLSQTNSLKNVKCFFFGLKKTFLKFQTIIFDYNLEEYIHYNDNKMDFYAIAKHSNVLVLSSLESFFNLETIAAMGCGIPTLLYSFDLNKEKTFFNPMYNFILRSNPSEIISIIARIKDNLFLRNLYSYIDKQVIKHSNLSSYISQYCNNMNNNSHLISSLLQNDSANVFHESLNMAAKLYEYKIKNNIPFSMTILLSVGEINNNKNHKLIIDALVDLPDCFFILCGKGPSMDQLNQYAKSLGVENRFRMVGFRKDVLFFYGIADIFVFPSFREGLPVALMEAMASELPCVASINRGTKELLFNSKYVHEPSDSKKLIEIIKDIQNNAPIDEISNNLETLKSFDITNTLEQFNKIYSLC